MSKSSPVLGAALREFRVYKRMAEKAAGQVDDAGLFRSPDTEGNSIAVIMRHMAGNMRSRWTDFLTSDGEKPDRRRDGEFEMAEGTRREDVLADWENGWTALFTALEPLTDEELGRTVMIRGEPHSVMQAVQRQVAHYAYHVGQIVLLARHWAGSAWTTLSIARGDSERFNREHWGPNPRPVL